MGRNSMINDANPIWWHLEKLVQIKNTRVWETQDRFGSVQNGDSSEESWTWLSLKKDNGKKKYRAEFANAEFWGQKWTFETSAVVKNQRVKQREQRSLGDCWQWKANGQCSKGDNCSFRPDMNKRAKSTQSNPFSRFSLQQSVTLHREPEVQEAEAQVGKWFDFRARTTSKELAPLHSVKNGILQNACFTRPRVVADLGKSARMHTARLMNSPAEVLKRMVTKVQWPCWKLHDNWVAYFKIWSRRSLQRFCGRALTYWSQSDVFDSPKPC